MQSTFPKSSFKSFHQRSKVLNRQFLEEEGFKLEEKISHMQVFFSLTQLLHIAFSIFLAQIRDHKFTTLKISSFINIFHLDAQIPLKCPQI